MIQTTSNSKLVAFSCFVIIFAGSACNIDPMFRDRRPPKGPVIKDSAGLAKAEAVSEIMATSGEADLVEAVVLHRGQYHKKLEELRDYYKSRGYANKQAWADFELKGLREVKAFRYLAEAEVPQIALQPAASIAEADAMYQRAMELMKQGGHGAPIFYRQKSMIEAADVFRGLVERYPSSDKVDDAAFQLGEIHREYMPGQELIAVKWYERAWTWNPNTTYPARFQAAVVYDYRLHDRDRALELYHEVLKSETGDQSNTRFSERRINELTSGERNARATP